MSLHKEFYESVALVSYFIIDMNNFEQKGNLKNILKNSAHTERGLKSLSAHS